MAKKSSKEDKAFMVTASALEITRFQRDSLKDQIEQLAAQLHAATLRAERAEERLHETTIMLSKLSLQATSHAVGSTLTEVLVEGRSILRLENPIHTPQPNATARHQ